MNLSDLPYGPLTPTTSNTFEVLQTVFDKKQKRSLKRTLLITGSDAFGLPRPTDDLVLLGLTTITSELGFNTRKVLFSRYHLCRVLRWQPDGKSYKRIEEALDRIAGATLKFKDGWWDNGDKQWRSHTFHILDNVELCSKERYDAMREQTSSKEQALCSIVWNEVIWKSFQDGFIRKVDMDLLARIANGRRRESAVRLFRLLDKYFYRKHQKRRQVWDVRKLCEGTLGSQSRYVSKMLPILERAAKVLIEAQYLQSMQFHTGKDGRLKAEFVKYTASCVRAQKGGKSQTTSKGNQPSTRHVAITYDTAWLVGYSETDLLTAESKALELKFGTDFERTLVEKERRNGIKFCETRLVRLQFLQRYLEEAEAASCARVSVT